MVLVTELMAPRTCFSGVEPKESKQVRELGHIQTARFVDVDIVEEPTSVLPHRVQYSYGPVLL